MQTIHRYSAILALSFSFIGSPANSYAQEINEKSILDKIAEIDARMQEGEIEFKVDGTLLSNGQKSLERHHTLLRYQQPDRLWQQELDTSTAMLYDGLDMFSFESRSNHVSIDRIKPLELRPLGYLLNVVNGASFPLGRGLSNLANLKILRQGAEIVARGETNDSFYMAILDSKHDFLASRIERHRKKGNMVNAVFELSRPVLTPSGQWIASRATYRVARLSGEVAALKNFEVNRANFDKPPDSYFNYIFAPDVIIHDSRLGHGVLLRDRRDRPMNKDEILPITKILEANQEQRLAQTAEYERSYFRNWLAKILLISISALLALLTGGYFYVRRPQN